MTDADLVLGYIDPGRFLGGKTRLKPELATEALERQVARPLGIGVSEAAWQVKRLIDGIILCLPNFGDENGAVEAFKDARLPILIQAYPDDLDKMGPALRRDGNAVDIEAEMAEMAESGLHYQTVLRLLSKKLQMLRSVATEGGK